MVNQSSSSVIPDTSIAILSQSTAAASSNTKFKVVKAVSVGRKPMPVNLAVKKNNQMFAEQGKKSTGTGAKGNKLLIKFRVN